ncbi:acetylglutamate kinase [Anaplasma phagocytophilum]|uniref:Acetylglutamate kinase n=3 Tax=Anaplasma phagocytophilum TaxID=948 RepID=A0A0F3NEI1_ANAPH|nr:acetylglutamate kinase [Anaplasma phagocytophilum]EOA61986.1 acetylglutamate kinase [Anaplasma phagocytophilum str. CRT38]KDB56956.1 acetylglutamate kinase [Anaplasma phagocytophilum str. CRT35]KJV66493.1 acetylglutamate kinase [Anaplasma phagocytophilum str. ApNP]KJV86671.1 acetylglutamate kinase [Anaplasma phagocytophilum str. CRT53-1]
MKFQDVSKGSRKENGPWLEGGQLSEEDQWLNEARVLSESIKCIHQFSGETFVIKYDGTALQDKRLADSFASDIVLLKQVGIHPIIVHGGNYRVEEVLEKFGKKEGVFVNDFRVVDSEVLEITEMVLSGLVNKEIVQTINENGGYAVGISGKDACLVEAKKVCFTARNGQPNNVEKIMDIGFVGEPQSVNTELLFFLEESDFIPIVSPICRGPNGMTHVVNPDLVAGAIASSLSAAKLVILADSAEDIKNMQHDDELLVGTVEQAEKLLNDGKVCETMVQRLQTCIKFARETCGTAHVVDGSIPHILLMELFTINGTGASICGDFSKD